MKVSLGLGTRARLLTACGSIVTTVLIPAGDLAGSSKVRKCTNMNDTDLENDRLRRGDQRPHSWVTREGTYGGSRSMAVNDTLLATSRLMFTAVQPKPSVPQEPVSRNARACKVSLEKLPLPLDSTLVVSVTETSFGCCCKGQTTCPSTTVTLDAQFHFHIYADHQQSRTNA